MTRFGSLLTWWIRDQNLTLKAFRAGGEAGASIAALKVLLALAVLVDFRSRSVRSSLSDLAELTGLSRPMLIKGIKDLEIRGILTVDRDGHINEYKLVATMTDERWAKVPYDLLRVTLRDLPNRGAVPLAALKVYLKLLEIRPNPTAKVALSHQKLRDFTGVQKRQIKPALDILFSHRLLHIDAVESEAGSKHNVYRVLGLGDM